MSTGTIPRTRESFLRRASSAIRDLRPRYLATDHRHAGSAPNGAIREYQTAPSSKRPVPSAPRSQRLKRGYWTRSLPYQNDEAGVAIARRTNSEFNDLDLIALELQSQRTRKLDGLVDRLVGVIRR